MKDMPKLKMEYPQWLIREKQLLKQQAMSMIEKVHYTTEDVETITAMQDKRLRKFKEMEKALYELETVKVYGNKKSKKAVICWGSTKGAVKEALFKIRAKSNSNIIFTTFSN